MLVCCYFSVNFYGRNDEKKPYAMAQYDLWAMQLDKIGKITGDLVVSTPHNSSVNIDCNSFMISAACCSPRSQTAQTK